MKRIDELDVLKGIAILLMILDHAFGWGPEVYLHKIIQSFHMPLFFIVGGYLWKAYDARDYFNRKIQTILRPHFNFAMFYSVAFLGLFALGKMSGGATVKSICSLFIFSTKSDLTMFASPIWFLQAFFLTCVVFTFLELKLERYCSFIIAMIGVMGIMYSELCTTKLPLALEPFSTGIIFFYIGYKMKNTECLKLKKNWHIIPIVLVWLMLVYLNGCVDMRTARYYNPVIYIVDGVLGTVIIWNIARWINRYKIADDLKHFSIYSISYLCMHYIFVYYGARVMDKVMPWTHSGARFILFCCVLGISWLANNIIMDYAPWILGRKNPNMTR